MKLLIIILLVLHSSVVLSQQNETDSLNILNARKEWVFKGSYSTYPEPWVPLSRKEKVENYLKNISTSSRFYQSKLALEKEMQDYFNEGTTVQQHQQSQRSNDVIQDSLNIVKAKKEWISPYKSFSYQPWIREEWANKILVKISPDSPFYEDRLALEKEMSDYFETWQPVVDERYNYYVNVLSGIRSYKSLLRKLVSYGFIRENFFTKEGNLFYDYSVLEYDGMIKILVQVKINYANDISYDVFTYCY